jgi:carboxyl-terminal processing protease
MRKFSLLLLGAASGVGLMLVAGHAFEARGETDARTAAPPANYRLLDVFGDAYEQVRKHYVEKPNDTQLMGTAINGMLSSLEDSYYVDAQTLRKSEGCTTHCDFAGVGISFTMTEGFAKIITAVDDSPAAKAGIQAGDIITEFDGQSAQALTFYQVAERLRGDSGTTLRMTIVRPGREKSIELALVRERLKAQSVKARAEGDVGYIRIAEFNEQTGEQLKKAIADLAAQIPADQLKGYVIDLRNDSGGRLEDAVAVADHFLDSGEIVSVRGRGTDDAKRFRATPGDLANGKRLVVLINAGSASAAEIVAGALQDSHRATIVGTRSFGQGSVGTLIPLGADNGALHLTTGHYVTPSGRLIEKKGIAPDVEMHQDLPDELKSQAKTEPKEPPLESYIPRDPKADKALNRGYELLRQAKADAPAPAAKPN